MNLYINQKGLVTATENKVNKPIPWHDARKRMLKAVEMLKKYEITI